MTKRINSQPGRGFTAGPKNTLSRVNLGDKLQGAGLGQAGARETVDEAAVVLDQSTGHKGVERTRVVGRALRVVFADSFDIAGAEC